MRSKCYKLVPLLFCCVSFIFSQGDSLLRKYNNAKTDSARWWTASEIASELLYVSPESSRSWADSTLKYARREKSIDGQAVGENHLGNLEFFSGNYSKAIEHFLASLKLHEKLNREHKVTASLNNIGGVYLSQSNFKMAVSYFRQALAISTKLNLKEDLADQYFNLGSAYLLMKEFDSSMVNMQKAYALAEELKSENLRAQLLANIGSLHLYKGDPSKALLHFSRAEKIMTESNDTYSIAVLYNSFAEAYQNLKQPSKILEYAGKAAELASKEGLKEDLKNSYNFLSIAYGMQKNFEKAYETHLRYSELKDSLLNEENSRQLNEMQTIFETEKKDKAIAMLNLDKQRREELNQSEARRKNQVIAGSIFILLIVLIFSFFLLKRFRITQRQNVIIGEQKKQVDRAFEQLHEKNKEVLDSIYYARRIQRALITNEKYFEKHLRKLNH